jgi:hypothetical protein
VNVPKKVKIFGWRVARDNLPTNKNKMKRSLELFSRAGPAKYGACAKF